MIEALENLLRDLEKNFRDFGIDFTKGQEFDMAEFGLTNHEDSQIAFYDPTHCDGINDNPELQATIAGSETPWVDATTHEYPKNVGRALYNATLRALWMTKNPGAAAPGIKTHKEYIDTNHRYMDNQAVETRGPAGEGVSVRALTRTPLIVDPRTEAFCKSYQQFLTVMANDPDPFKDAKANCWVPGASGLMDAGTPKTISGFQTSLFVVNERLAIYNARKNENLLNAESFIASTTAAAEKTNELTRSATEIEAKYNPFFESAKTVEQKINRTDLSKMSIKEKEQFIKTTIAQLEELKKNAITQEAIQSDIDTLTYQYRTLSNNDTIALPHTPSYQEGLYQSNIIADSFHSAEKDALSLIHETILKLTSYKNTLTQIVKKQEAQLKKLQGELRETAPQLINKIEAINFSIEKLNGLIQSHERLSLHATQFDEIAMRVTWDDEIVQLAALKKRLMDANQKLSAHDQDQPIDETLFKELGQILAWSPADVEAWNYVTKPAGILESSASLLWSTLSSLSFADKQKSRTELLQDAIDLRLNNLAIDPNRKKTELETTAATTQGELTLVEDSLSLLNKYFGEKGQANEYLKNREREYAVFDTFQSITRFFRRGPTEKEKRRDFFSEIGALVKNYEQDRNPAHLQLALNKINAKKTMEQFKSRTEYKKSMQSVLNKLSWDIYSILDKNTLHTQYFHPENGKIGFMMDILNRNEHWKDSHALKSIETISSSIKEYGHDNDTQRINRSISLIDDLLDHWDEITPHGASHVSTMKFTLESLKSDLENRALLIKYLGKEGIFAKSMELTINDNTEAKIARINYLANIGKLIENFTHDKNPAHLEKALEKIDAVIQEGSTLFAEDRAKGKESIQAVLTGFKAELTQAYGRNHVRIQLDERDELAPHSGNSGLVMAH